MHTLINWCWPQVRPGFLELCRPCWCGSSGSGRALSLSLSLSLSRHDLWPFATPLPLAWQRPSSPVQSVNEVEDPRAGWRIRRGCQCVKGCWLCGDGLAPPMQEVSCVVMVGHVCLLVLTRLCCTIGFVCGLPVVVQNFLENGPPWGTGWCCCACPSLPEYIECTLPALAATPLTPLQRTWSNESGWLSFISSMSFMWFTRSLIYLCSSTHLVSVAT